MSDPLKDLQELSSVPTTPLPAHEVRRRGTRMRRRRQALGVVGSVAAVALIATGGTLLVNNAGERAATGPAASPTHDLSAEPTLGPVSTDNLLRTAETKAGDHAWQEGETFQGDGQYAPNVCMPEGFRGLGAESLRQRTWYLDGGTLQLQHAVSSYESPAAAAEAFETFAHWLETCASGNADGYSATTIDTETPAAHQQLAIDATWSVPDAEEGGESFAAHRTVTGLVRIGDRVSVLIQDSPEADDADYGWEEPPVVSMLETTADRLEVVDVESTTSQE